MVIRFARFCNILSSFSSSSNFGAATVWGIILVAIKTYPGVSFNSRHDGGLLGCGICLDGEYDAQDGSEC